MGGNAQAERAQEEAGSTDLQQENGKLRVELAKSNENLERARKIALENLKHILERMLDIVRKFYFLNATAPAEIPAASNASQREHFKACGHAYITEWLQWRTMSLIFSLLDEMILSRPYFGLGGLGEMEVVEH
ncbi:hypothetical protein L207DRAFT_522342 [Hyaloscypha variabilis F]|uniref:Uncharacterized protein n=1 Tax=Hyaloscypha variabilis (strain UAMH 11265 / GT02V1 / F) TaxID=1149755 RepID=A0A2J6SE46_HYAVF|nr:hypothetical protein L207DRAFT_522342 [Hyaloscypha variabilis F]